MYKNKAFTIVELIVSVTIVTILATIATVWVLSYLVEVRDSARVWQIQSIGDGIDLFMSKWKNLEPENPLYIYFWSGSNYDLYSLQWYAWKSVLDKIKFSSDGVDPSIKSYFTFSVGIKNKKYDIISFLENINNHPLKDNFTEEDKNTLDFFPYIYWKKKVWILLNSNNEPVNLDNQWDLMVNCDWNSGYSLYFSNDDIFFPIKSQNINPDLPCFDDSFIASCETQPTYIHAIFNAWIPIYENQSWQLTNDDNQSCRYSCKPWFSWLDCNQVTAWTWFCPTNASDLTSNPNYSAWTYNWDIDCYGRWLTDSNLSMFSSLTQVNGSFDLWANELTNVSNIWNININGTLNLASNNITDISWFWTVTIDVINLNYNDLTNLNWIDSVNINTLIASNNYITNISSINGKYIDYLYLNNNNISDISWLDFGPQFAVLDISWNQNIIDLTVFNSLNAWWANDLYLDDKIYNPKINSNSKVCTHWNVYDQNGTMLSNKLSICN